MGYKDKLIIFVSILQEIRRTKNYRKKKISFSDLAEKLEHSKDLEELLVKTKKMISKATELRVSLQRLLNLMTCGRRARQYMPLEVVYCVGFSHSLN